MDEYSEKNKILKRMSQKIDEQESKILKRDYEDMRESYEKSQKVEIELKDQLHKGELKCGNLERELERRIKQLDESSKLMRTLQQELEELRDKYSREKESYSKSETSVLSLNNRNSALEARLQRREAELEVSKRIVTNLEQRLKISDEKKRSCEKEFELYKNNPIFTSDKNDLQSLNRQIGSLKTMNENLQKLIDHSASEKHNLEKQLQYANDESSTLKLELSTLKTQLTDSELFDKRLLDEIDKVKHQKAEIRCDNVMLKKNNEKILCEMAQLQQDTKSVQLLKDQVNKLEEEKRVLELENHSNMNGRICLENKIAEIQTDNNLKLAEFERKMNETGRFETNKIENMEVEMARMQNRIDGMISAMFQVDRQCSELMDKLKASYNRNSSLRAEKLRLLEDNKLFQKQLDLKCKMENELISLKEKNKSLQEKVSYLNSELDETHNDHRNEIAKLANEVGRNRNNEKQDENLDSRLRQQQSLIASLERKLEQAEHEKNAAIKSLNDSEVRLNSVSDESRQLREKFVDLLNKAEEYRDQVSDLKTANENFQAEIKEFSKQMTTMEDTISELRGELEAKEGLVAYFHSVVPSKHEKLPRIATSQSTLVLSTDSIETPKEYRKQQQCLDLSQRKRKNNVSIDKEIQADPLIQNSSQSGSHSNKFPRNFAPTLTSSPLNAIPIMRHDIPHRWKTQFITITKNKCSFCYDGVPHFGHVLKCKDCSTTAHLHCRQFIGNTCGLSETYRRAWENEQSASEISISSSVKMSGWVKIWHESSSSDGQWRTAWATIDRNQLSFYDDENMAYNNGEPFLAINLDTEQWRIYNQTTSKPVVEGVQENDCPMLIEIKLPAIRLFMLAPTVQSKKKWVRALQQATSRRISIQRHPSSITVANSLLLALDAPRYLNINCAQILDLEWLLLGTQEGLFATTLNNPCLPFTIAGLSSVFFIELVAEYNALLIITGSQRQFGVVHVQQLRHAVTTDNNPSVRFTSFANVSNCHLAVVSKPNHIYGERFVYAATIDGINILQYSKKLDVFNLIKKIRTEEPCMCICSMPGGFIFGADNFHFLIYKSNPTTSESIFSQKISLEISNCPIDFPISALEITPGKEYLLAFHNYGVFVTQDGHRSRTENIDWERIPLEFVYVEPYLYIVYCDFMEVVKIADRTGLDSHTLTADRSMFKCQSAHCVGFGPKKSDVIFSVSSQDRVELHLFNHTK